MADLSKLLKTDFRLIAVSAEMQSLQEHYHILKGLIANTTDFKQRFLERYIQGEGLTPDDPEWHLAHDEYMYDVEIILPKLVWGPFLIALFAAYESSITEISKLIQEKKSLKIAIDQIKGDFLERAKLYFKEILNFQLYVNETDWKNITTLLVLRNVYAHTNGQFELLKPGVKNKIKKLEEQQIGISENLDYVICERALAHKLLKSVQNSVSSLVDRYKQQYTP